MALSDNIVSYWKLDETSGTRNDSVGSNHLTDENTVGSATGLLSNAADFERSNSERLSLTSNTSIECGDIDFFFSAWVNAESLTNFSYVISKRDNFFNDYELYYLGGQFYFEFGGVIVSVGSISTGAWYNVVVWHDSTGNQIGIAVNDGTPATTSTGGTFYSTSGTFSIGGRGHTGADYWDGLVDEVGFWKRLITSQDRTDLYGSGTPPSYPFGGGGTAVPVFLHHLANQG